MWSILSRCLLNVLSSNRCPDQLLEIPDAPESYKPLGDETQTLKEPEFSSEVMSL
jgi:hypothetical protein